MVKYKKIKIEIHDNRVLFIIGLLISAVCFCLACIYTNKNEIKLLTAYLSFIIWITIAPFLLSSNYWRLHRICGSIGIAFVKLGIKIIYADGELIIKEKEKLIFYMQHKYGDPIVEPLIEFIKNTRCLSESIGLICAPLASQMTKERVEVLYRLFKIASADNVFSDKEEIILKEISKGLNLDLKRFNIIKKSILKEKGYKYSSEHQQNQQNQSWNYYVFDQLLRMSYNPFAIIGIEQNASNEEIKHAYRTLAKQYHPDKSMHESVEIKRQNAIKIQEINEAYEAIKKMRGIK